MGFLIAGEIRHMLNAMGLGSGIDEHHAYALNFFSPPVKLQIFWDPFKSSASHIFSFLRCPGVLIEN
jgi:hypothetical protein